MQGEVDGPGGEGGDGVDLDRSWHHWATSGGCGGKGTCKNYLLRAPNILVQPPTLHLKK